MSSPKEHPSFALARSLPEPWRSHFPKTAEEVAEWVEHRFVYALGQRVLAVARTRVECAWAAYIGDVNGWDHGKEWRQVLESGDKLPEHVARALFPKLKDVPYGD